MPPLRAVLEGTNGASKRSANAMAYPSPKEFLPKYLIKSKEIRFSLTPFFCSQEKR